MGSLRVSGMIGFDITWNRRISIGNATPDKGFYAQGKLQRAKRLGEVVVAARSEAHALVDDIASRRQEDDGSAHAALSQTQTGLETVHIGHGDVQDDSVGALRIDTIENLETVPYAAKLVPVFQHDALDNFAQVPIVVCEHDLHDATPPPSKHRHRAAPLTTLSRHATAYSGVYQIQGSRLTRCPNEARWLALTRTTGTARATAPVRRA